MTTNKFLLSAAMSGALLGIKAHAEDKKASSTTSTTAAPVAAKGQCHGVNSCKGTGACGGATHNCHAKNSCKGKGWLSMTEKECVAKKGKFVAEK